MNNIKDMHKEILKYVYSKEICDYINKHKEELNLFQWGTLIINFWKGSKLEIFKQLRDMSNSEYERQLFDVAIKDIRKYNDISNRAIKYYLKNDPRGSNKPNIPFNEIILFPILFDCGDIVSYENNMDEFYFVWKKPHIEENDDSYLCYLLNNEINNKEDMFANHAHLSAFLINKVDEESIPIMITENKRKLQKLIDKYGDDLLK